MISWRTSAPTRSPGALAIRSGRGRRRWRRGFRLTLLDTFSRPRLHVRSAGPDAAFIEWTSHLSQRKGADGTFKRRRPFKGRFLDLREAIHALTGEKHTLASAAARFGIEEAKGDPGAFGLVTRPLLDYLRRDVDLTWALFLAVREEWNRHPFTPVPSLQLSAGARAVDTPDLSPEAHLLSRMRSAASLAKSYLARMGLRPRLEVEPDFPPEALGQAMGSFYGGRIEARADLQGAIWPVMALDVVSTYLSVNVLMSLDRWDTAARLRVEDCTGDARRVLDALTLDDLFRPDTWPGLAVFCEVEFAGDFLPVRFPEEPGDAPTCRLKRLHSGQPGQTLWFALPDLLHSKFATGQTARIVRAWRLVPEGTLPGLRPVQFRGEVTLDPHADFHRAFRDARLTDVQPRLRAAQDSDRDREAVELDRLQRAMKAVGEPLSYGVYVEADEKDLLPREAFERGEARADVWAGRGHFEARITREEYPGRWFFSPRGSIVTSGARLLLGMMERLIAQAGGIIVAMHTDSGLVVATASGGEIGLPRRPGERDPMPVIRALSYGEVERIRQRFASLSGIPGLSLWKRERTNDPHPDATRDRTLYVLSYGPGRYALFNRADDGRILLRDRKETALGHLIAPTGYTRDQAIDAVWEALIREARSERGAVARLPFAREPALGRLPITTPDLLRRIRTRPHGSRKATAPSPRPFGFLTTAYTMSDNALSGRRVYRSGWCRFRRRESVGCPAPREACPHRASCPLAYPIQPATYDAPGPDLLKKGRWFDWRTGEPLTRLHAMPEDFSGMLRVRTWAEYVRHTLAHSTRWWLDDGPDVRVIGVVHTGKEARHLEDIAASLRIPGEEVLHYDPEPADPNDAILRALCRRIPMRFLIEQTRLSRRGIQLFRNGHTQRLHPAHQKLLWQAVALWVHDHPEVGMVTPTPPASEEAAGG